MHAASIFSEQPLASENHTSGISPVKRPLKALRTAAVENYCNTGALSSTNVQWIFYFYLVATVFNPGKPETCLSGDRP
jgi:hypothetical protein